jgi:carbonic anhydrase
MKTHLFLVLLFGSFIIACTTEETSTDNKNHTQEMIKDVITKDQQASLTPGAILQGLKDGNERFVRNDLSPRDLPEQVKKTANGQFPEAVILSCIDSRVPVEHVFDKGIGDVFVARVAGNTVNPDILGSIEYGAAVAGSKVIVVMGHKSCGAVQAAIDQAELSDNADVLLSRVQPAIDALNDYEGDKTSGNADYVDQVVKKNVHLTVDEMLEKSPVLRNLLDEGEIMVVGAYYDLDSGKVTFLD